jgi:hypothetical protein
VARRDRAKQLSSLAPITSVACCTMATANVLAELSQLVRANKKLAVVRRLESYAAKRRKLQGAYKELLERPRDRRALARYEAAYKRELRLYKGDRALGLRACAQRPEDPIEVMRGGPLSRIRAPKPAP